MPDNVKKYPWRTDVNAAALLIEQVLPDQKLRKIVLNDISNAILFAHSLSPVGWNLRLDRRLIRFSSALKYMFNVFDSYIGVTIDQSCVYLEGLLLPAPNGIGDFAHLHEFADRQTFHVVLPVSLYRQYREELVKSNLLALKRDLTPTKSGTPRRIHGTMPQAHSMATIRYITQVLSVDLPQPAYCSQVASIAPAGNEISVTEGEIISSIANEYKRDPHAREKCLSIHGCQCIVCGFNFSTVYGPSFARLAHAHHLSPFSEKPGERQTDPRHDMRPVCPNCHAVIHSRNPAYSISEVQAMLSKLD